MGRIGFSFNRYGTPISQQVCDSCGTHFTICPPAGEDWGGCQAEGCASYDEKRDMDKLFDESPWKIKREAHDSLGHK